MKIRSLLTTIILGCSLLSVAPVQAQRVTGKSEIKASNRFEASDARMRVTAKKKEKLQVHHGIVATVNAMYYSGDIIQPMPALKSGDLINNFGASLTLNYKMTLNVYVSMRFGIQGGFLQGTNQKAVDKGQLSYIHQFNSLFAEPFVGVEVYPILNYGFFIYGGFGVAASQINYKHTKKRVSEPYEKKGWTGMLPMAQFGLGYNWWLNQDWTLGVELMGQIGVTDGRYWGLDGWPIKEAYDLNDPTELKAYKNAMMPDGWLQLGLVVSYHFKK